ncbi:hypothetical protein [Gordonia alkanivorans]|uniref:hypothetical protein n=1 Tax=Gordonia alkanivorans TaxID=84096 RepID=UPI001F4E5572|nr:hypothetical protein [Gordonia alkanivorans]
MFDQPDTEWMLWTGIGVTVLDVLIGIGVASMSYRGESAPRGFGPPAYEGSPK